MFGVLKKKYQKGRQDNGKLELESDFVYTDAQGCILGPEMAAAE